MFWDILSQSRQALLKKIVQTMPVPDSYLAGGTGLALMLGHRESVDFDWFTPHEFDPQGVYLRLSQIGKVMVTETTKGTFHGFVDGVRATWLHYPNPLLKPRVKTGDLPGFHLASLLDIGLMKLVALSQRGARKDFIDLYFICRQGFDLENLIRLLPEKYPEVEINYYHVVKSLSYFEDAEREVMPKMRLDLDWKKVKIFFLEAQKTILKQMGK